MIESISPPPFCSPEKLAALIACKPPEAEEPEVKEPALNVEAVIDQLRTRMATDQQADDWIFQNEIRPRLKECGFLDRHQLRIVKWNCIRQERTYRWALRKCRGEGCVIALVGNRGTGKTTIAAQMAIARAEDPARKPWERTPPYRKLADVIARYKPLYADFGTVDIDGLLAARDAFCRAPLMFIDEIHECSDAKFKARILTDIIDRRYAGLKDTILISNETKAAFEASIGDSVLSRMQDRGPTGKQLGAVVECNWESWRK